ncbi:MAG TPA: choice-of-anchor D domain-containing protein [Chryseosolibacter sp.]
MRLPLLTIFSMVMVNVFAQVPQITVSRNAISTSVTAGGTTTQTFTITNTGNRDLNWELKFIGAAENFTKANFTESTQARAQDRITPKVWLTRNSTGGLFNAFREMEAGEDAPADTEWAFGKTEELSVEDYRPWLEAIDYTPEDMIDNVMSMHAISEDRYFDITFHSFSTNYDGGGFSYTRVEQGLKWASADFTSGRLIPGQSKTITITFDASGLLTSFYTGNVAVISNDPSATTKLVGLTLDVQGGAGSPEITAPTEKEFGTGFVNFATQRIITINNSGTAPLRITNVASSNTSFVPEAVALTIAPGRGFDLPVMFMPTSAGIKSATLTLTTNDADETTFPITLTAIAQVPPSSAVDNFSYNVTAASGTTNVQNLVLRNTGTADLTYAIELEFPAATPVTFSKVNFGNPSLPENQDRITPDIRLTSDEDYGLFNAATEDSFDWEQSPLGTTWANVRTAEAEYYSTWDNVLDGEAEEFINRTTSMYIPAQDRYFDITLTSWTCCGNGGGFSYVRTEVYNWLTADPAEGTVAGGQNQTISLNINTRGLAVGTYNGTVVIRSNDPTIPTRSIPVTLNVTGAPDAKTHESAVNFGSTAVGNISYQKVRVLNDGPAYLNVTGVTFSDNEFMAHEVNGTIAPFSYGLITISFTPTTVETLTGNITISTSDANHPTLQIPYTAQSISAGDITVVAEDLNATVSTGNYETRSFTIENQGAGPLTWTSRLANSNAIVEFTKTPEADWTSPYSQDRITPNVWLTTVDGEGLLNAAIEKTYNQDVSPAGTLWNYGTTFSSELDEYDPWDYVIDGWADWVGGHTFSLHTGREYYDVKFTSWTRVNDKGGFSYERQKANGWLKLSSTEGTIEAGQSVLVTVTYDPSDYLPGTFNETLVIESNDPDKSSVEVPIQVTIEGIAAIAVQTDDVSFGNYGLNLTKTMPVVIKNTGTIPLVISSIEINNPAFTVSANELTIPVDGESILNVKFKPTSVANYTGTLTLTSNAENESGLELSLSGSGVQVPDISVTPGEITYRTTPETVFTGNIDIKNSGAETLNWAIGKASSYPLTHILESLNANYTQITDLVPSKYSFAYDGGAGDINDGGYDMYDGGNMLNTNLQQSIPYSDNLIISGQSAFGPNSKYFTRHLNGMFVMVADLNGVERFSIEGNNGADGGGSLDAAEFTSVLNGTEYKGYAKRIFNNSDPSINQLMIIESDPGVTHEYSLSTNEGHQQLANLNNVKRVYYLLFAARTTSAVYVDNATTKAIMDKFLDVITGNVNGALTSWLTLDVSNGTVEPGATQTIHYTADLTDYADGNYSYDILVGSNDLDKSIVTVPLNINKGTILISNEVDDILVNEGFGSKVVEFSDVFTDGNGDPLTYAVGSNLQIVTGTLSHNTLTLTEIGVGTSIVSIRAEDPNGNVTYADFNFRVNDIPNVVTPIDNIGIAYGFGSTTVEASTVFVDNDEQDALTLTVTSSDPSVVTTTIADGIINITEGSVGSTTITLTANDGVGGIASESFVVTVDKAIATLAASNTTTTYDGAAKVISIATTPANLTVEIVYTQNGSTVAAPTNAGIYDVTATIKDAYFAGSYSGTLTINKANQTITFDALPGVMNSNAPFTISATSSAGLPVNFTKISGPITINGTTITLTGEVGEAIIAATQPGNENYNAAATVNRTLTIVQDPILSVDDPLTAHVQAYPVPAKEYLSISTGTYRMARVTLTDSFGRMVYSEQPNRSEHTINTSTMTQGIYILQVVTEKGLVSRRVEVMK